LRDKVVVLTGASSGIGAASAVALAGPGTTIALIARRADLLEQVAEQVRAAGGTASTHPVDLRDHAAARRVAEQISRQHGIPDVVILNAGHSIGRTLLDSVDRFDTFERTIDINYLGAVAIVLPWLAGMAQRRSGQVIGVTSSTARMPMPGWAAYCASKSAFDTWLRAAGPELRRHGIATTVLPFPLVDTAMARPTYGPGHWAAMPVDEAARWVVRAVADRPATIKVWWQRPGEIIGIVTPVWGARLAALWSLRYAARAGRAARRPRRPDFPRPFDGLPRAWQMDTDEPVEVWDRGSAAYEEQAAALWDEFARRGWQPALEWAGSEDGEAIIGRDTDGSIVCLVHLEDPADARAALAAREAGRLAQLVDDARLAGG